MFNFRFHAAVRRLRRHLWRVTTLGLLVALAATSLGVALPGKVVKQTDVPFPCMNSPCGCTDAETCWRSCCCHSHAEKIAWAKEHGVTPPDYVVAEARKPACCQRKEIAVSCCSGGKVRTCSTAKQSCCDSGPKTGGRVLVYRNSAKDSQRKTVRVRLVDALRCQGLASSWLLFPPTIVPPPAALTDAPAALVRLAPIVESSYRGVTSAPDVPPPKNVA